MGKKNEAPPPPDYTPIAKASERAAERSYELSKEQFEWAKKTYAEDKQVTDRVVESFLDTMDFNQATAERDRARYEDVYQPLEDSLAAEAEDYASESRRETEMGRASAQVAQQFSGAREAAQRELESFGINPADTRYAALDLDFRTRMAAAQAAAANQASRSVDDTARALRSEAINVGRGYPGQVAGQYGTAMQGGAGATGQQLAQTASGASTMGTAPQYSALGNESLGQWANVVNTGYQNQLAGHKVDQQTSSGWGSALGMAAGVGAKAFLGPTMPWVFAEEGGAIPESASPSGGAIPDDVGAALTAGEFVIPDDVVKWKGEEFFQKLIEGSREKRQTAAAPAIGGNQHVPQQAAVPAG